MDEKKLKGFVSIYENRSMTKAAEKIYTTPPALMRQLDALESELGAKLFRRSPSGCVPTETGTLLYNRIVPVLEEIQQIRTQIEQMTKDSSRLKLCVPATGSLPLVDMYCEQLIQFCPHAEIQYVPIHAESWIDQVKSCEADAALLSDNSIPSVQEAGLMYEFAGERPIICIMASRHPLASKASLCASDLIGQNICVDVATHAIVQKKMKEHQIQVKVLQNEMTPSELFNLCRKNGIRMTSSPYGEQFSSLISVPIDLPPMRCGWVTRKKQTEIVKELIRISREYNNQI